MSKQSIHWSKKRILVLVSSLVSLAITLYTQEIRVTLEAFIRFSIRKIAYFAEVQEFWLTAVKLIFVVLIVLVLLWGIYYLTLALFLWAIENFSQDSEKYLPASVIFPLAVTSSIAVMFFLVIIAGKASLSSSLNLYSFATSPVEIRSDIDAEWKILKLKKYLERGSWMKADVETSSLLNELLQNSTNNSSSFTNFKQLPCRDLRSIDNLWTYYSNGRFGYSVQESIFEEVGKDIFRFGDQVGWRNGIEWIFSNDYDLSARKGHLPSPVILPEPPRLQRTEPPGLQRTDPPIQLPRARPPGLQRTEIPGAENLLEAPQSFNRKPLAAIVPIPKSCEIK